MLFLEIGFICPTRYNKSEDNVKYWKRTSTSSVWWTCKNSPFTYDHWRSNNFGTPTVPAEEAVQNRLIEISKLLHVLLLHQKRITLLFKKWKRCPYTADFTIDLIRRTALRYTLVAFCPVYVGIALKRAIKDVPSRRIKKTTW